jgi:hypothetical protein
MARRDVALPFAPDDPVYGAIRPQNLEMVFGNGAYAASGLPPCRSGI